MYLNGHSTKEISDKIGVSTRQVRNILRSKGVTIRGKRRTNGRKVNEDFFKTWSNEMAYVLGFVITDGNISNSTLAISQNERYILEEIRIAMDSDYEIKRRKNGVNDIYVLSMYRKEIVDDLKALGISEGKSRVVEFPEVPDEYLSHFIRGVIDGDGWVQDRGYVMNVTNASKPFSESLHSVFNRLGYNGRIVEDRNAYRVWISGKEDVARLADWVYEDKGELYLRRKFDRMNINKTLAS